MKKLFKEYKYKSSKKFTELLDKTLEKMNEEYFKIQPVDSFMKKLFL